MATDGRVAEVRARQTVGGGEILARLGLGRVLLVLVRWGAREAFEDESWRVVVVAGRGAGR